MSGLHTNRNLWQPEEVKSCMMLTGRPVTAGGKPSGDHKKLFCSGTTRYSHVITDATVSLDSEAEALFGHSDHWGIVLGCTRVDKKTISCDYAGD